MTDDERLKHAITVALEAFQEVFARSLQGSDVASIMGAVKRASRVGVMAMSSERGLAIHVDVKVRFENRVLTAQETAEFRRLQPWRNKPRSVS